LDKGMVRSIERDREREREREREKVGVQWRPTYICLGEHYLFTASIFSNSTL